MNTINRFCLHTVWIIALAVVLLGMSSPAAAAGLRPGIYQLRSVSSDWCVGYRAGGGLRLPYLAMGDCAKTYARNPSSPALGILLGIPVSTGGAEVLGYSPIAVVPHPQGGYTLRSVPPYYARMNSAANGANRLLSCVTVARNVVIGPPGIDIWPCDLPNGAPWSQAGAPDQRFSLNAAPGDGNFTISHVAEANDRRGLNCIDVRGASQDINTDLVDWECNRQANQTFHFVWLGPLTTRDDMATSDASSPTLASRVLIPLPPVIRQGVNFPGMDIAGSDTPNDGGTICLQSCQANTQCRAFSWVRPGMQGPNAKCWLKGGVPVGQPDPNVNSGIVNR